VTTTPVDRGRRLALLLADGSGDFDFIRLAAFEDTVILEGRVPSYEHKRRASDMAEYVGFEDVRNLLRVVPAGENG
jgi:osmotically-inducible protein OsmY